MLTTRAQVAGDTSYRLGEGPVWDDGHDRLVWVDIAGCTVLCGRLGADHVEVVEEHAFDDLVATAVPTDDGGLLVALGGGALTSISTDGTRRSSGICLDVPAGSRLNDGACDPAGRLLIGSMSLDGRHGVDRLWQVAGGGAWRVVDDGFTLSNGLGWSPDGTTMYHVDSVPGVVWAREYDAATGAAGQARELLRFPDETPDGLCVDTDGRLWIAVHGGGQVRCYDPTGEHVATVEVEAPNTTSVAFVGPQRDRLLITTARSDLLAHPHAGRLFLADVQARGVPTRAWSGRCVEPGTAAR